MNISQMANALQFYNVSWQKYVWVKNSFKVQERPLVFNIMGYEKLIDMVSDFTLQLTFKKLLLVV